MHSFTRKSKKILGTALQLLLRCKSPAFFGRFLQRLERHFWLSYLADRWRNEEDDFFRIFLGKRPSGKLKISIVIPTFNVSLPYIKELIASIRNQTYSNWEVCICDDADPLHDVANYLQGLSNTDRRFRYTRHEKNSGISLATRTALTLVTGDAIAFVDADDLLHRRAIEAVALRFEEDPEIDFVFTDHDLLTDWGQRKSPIRKPGWQPELLDHINYINHLVVVRRDCAFKSAVVFDGRLSGAQDWRFCWKATQLARKVSHLPLILYHWRQRPGSVALSGAEKPWACTAALEAVAERFQTFDPRLALSKSNNLFKRFQPTFADDASKLPSIHVFSSFDATQKLKLTYRGQLIFHRDNWFVNGSLSTHLKTKPKTLERDALVLFLSNKEAEIIGDLESWAAFSLKPEVACVWPFQQRRLRGGYTIDENSSRLVPITEATSTFSWSSGNVLTGPLHGLLIRSEVLLTLLENINAPALESTCGAFDSIGAEIGLHALEHGFRNVSTTAALSTHPLEHCDVTLNMKHDPYF